MSAYLSGSGVKGDSMQTLYLMNPSYPAYNDSSNSGNMVLLSPTVRVANQDLLGNPAQQQQQPYAGFSLPQTVPQQTESAQEVFANRLSNQGYSWNGGNELLFLPASDMRGDSQSLSARLNSLNTGQNPASGIMSHLDTASLSQSSFHEHNVPFIPSGVAVGLSSPSLQTSTGAGQILSLSLSPQQHSLNQLQSFPIQHPELAVNGGGPGLNSSVLENFSNKGSQWMGIGNALDSLRISTPIVRSGFHGQLTGAANSRQTNMLLGSPKIELYTSKYLKPAQQLLNEVVSVGRVSKTGSAKNQAKPQSWCTPKSFGSGYGQEKNPMDTGSKDVGAIVSWGNGKEQMLNVLALPTAVSESQDQNVENLVELTAPDRQELQIKKAKLLAMVDEVDQRYRQYHYQLQMVVASFETTAGLGAAQTYTALALQTISKHFRCLKDAIKGQIQAVCKALGEEDGRGEASRLRFIDQQLLRQQHALQQLGMMPQHPWRPQRGLPERSVSVLRAWLFEHFLHPYPKDSDKILLARQTGLTRNQVSNWFINARVRLWKPMVEEMYAEEMKDEEDAEGADKRIDRADDGGTGVQDGGRKNGSDRSQKQGSVSNIQSQGFLEVREAADRQDNNSDKVLTSSLSDNLLLPEREGMSQGLKRARSDLTADVKMRSYDLHSGHALAKPRTDDAFGMPTEGLVEDDEQSLGSYGILHLSGLNRYADNGLTATYPSSMAVSLTLGLQHSEGLSVSAVQQGYVHGQSQLHMGRRPEGEINAMNFYGMPDMSGGHIGNFEVMNIQDRKRFSGHMLQQDFT